MSPLRATSECSRSCARSSWMLTWVGSKVFRLRWLGVIPVSCQSSRLELRGTGDEFLQARLGSCLETKAVRSTSHIVAPRLTHTSVPLIASPLRVTSERSRRCARGSWMLTWVGAIVFRLRWLRSSLLTASLTVWSFAAQVRSFCRRAWAVV